LNKNSFTGTSAFGGSFVVVEAVDIFQEDLRDCVFCESEGRTSEFTE
jgi:hypothetical protein